MLICRNAEGVHGQKKVGNLKLEYEFSVVCKKIPK